MNYRLATLNDIYHVCSLVGDVIKQMEDQGIYQWDSLYPTREDFYIDINKKTLYVVEDGHKFVAIYVISQEYDNEYKKCEWNNPDETACIIHRLCVAPGFQNKGIGKKVLRHIEERGFADSFQIMELEESEFNREVIEMAITVNIYYSGVNENARRFAEEMISSGVVADIRAEHGNIRYEYFFPIDDKETVLLIDSWKDQHAIDVHHASPMMEKIAELREKYDLHMKVERYVSDENGVPETDKVFIKE